MKFAKIILNLKLCSVIFFLLNINSCSTISDADPKDKPVWRFGIVRIDIEKYEGGAKALDVMSIGLWSDQESAGIGFNNMKTISLNDSCRLVFIVDNKEQLENMKKFLKESDELNGVNICVTKK